MKFEKRGEKKRSRKNWVSQSTAKEDEKREKEKTPVVRKLERLLFFLLLLTLRMMMQKNHQHPRASVYASRTVFSQAQQINQKPAGAEEIRHRGEQCGFPEEPQS